MSMQKRALASAQPIQPKKPCFSETEEVKCGSISDLLRRVVREEVQRARYDSPVYCQSCCGNAFKEIAQQMHSMENASIELKEALELASIQSTQLGRGNAKSTSMNGARNLQLQFRTKLPDTLFTGKTLEGEGGVPISVALTDANTGEVVTSGPESSIKLGVVVLRGDFNKDYEDDWAQEEFERYVVKERRRKWGLLTGDPLVTLKGGVGELGELTFTDNSSWTRSGTFRIGLKVASGYCGNTRIREAKTDAFRVKEHRGELSKKHDLPAFDDEVWRLKTIAKDGKYHQKLSKAGICKVGDFLLHLSSDPIKLKEILGMSSNSTKWDILQNHAKSCKTNWKLYSYYPDGVRMPGAVFNTDRQLIGLIKDRIYCSAHLLSSDEKEHGDAIVKKAFDNWNDVREFNAENLPGSMQKESSSLFTSQVTERQNENPIPVESILAPQICAASVGLEAPPANAGSTAGGTCSKTETLLSL